MTAAVAHPVAIKIDLETKARLKRLADARHRTPHWLMREAVSQYLEREEKRESFRQGARNAWDEYKTTGLHASADEVEAWLASWGSEGELPVPVCQS
jgi:predicted transcriptional regulator